ncbi:hypothetical protein [Haladaptatus sp. CMAA 1911]|uniref:hypothetical protein n=1 Tax=unclassified Haladaptatus TaxID=2622732 RepID=UPI003754BCA8
MLTEFFEDDHRYHIPIDNTINDLEHIRYCELDRDNHRRNDYRRYVPADIADRLQKCEEKAHDFSRGMNPTTIHANHTLMPGL